MREQFDSLASTARPVAQFRGGLFGSLRAIVRAARKADREPREGQNMRDFSWDGSGGEPLLNQSGTTADTTTNSPGSS